MSYTTIVLSASSLIILLWLVYRYSLLLPPDRGLPILMYHKVIESLSDLNTDNITVSVPFLRRQLAYLHRNGYTPISFSDLRKSQSGDFAMPEKPVIITFDDGYQSAYEFAYPLLKELNFKATIFLPTAFIGGINEWDNGNDQDHEL